MSLIQHHKRQLQLQRRCCGTEKAGIQPIGHRLNPRPWDFDLRLNSHTQSLAFNGLLRRNPCTYTDCYSCTDH